MEEDLRLSRFLQDLDLGKYHENLVDEGFDSMERCANADLEDFLAVGMKRGHAKQLLAALSSKRYSNGVLEMRELVQASAAPMTR